MKKVLALMVAVLVLVSMFAVCFTASAAVGLDFGKKGTITLEKKDLDGNPIPGATFTDYKVMSLEKNQTEYVSNPTDEDPNATIALPVQKDEGTYVLQAPFKDKMIELLGADAFTDTGCLTSTGYLYESTEDLEKIIVDLVPVSQTATGTNFTESQATPGTYSVELDLGIYLVVETAVPDNYNITTSAFLVTVPQWDGAANNGEGQWIYEIAATPKDSPVDVDKKVGIGEDAVDHDVYAIGSTVPFVVTATIPNYGVKSGTNQKLTDYITDEMYEGIKFTLGDDFCDGLTFNADSLVLTIEGEATALKAAASADKVNRTRTTADDADLGDYYLAIDENGDFEVTVGWPALDNFQGKNVVMTYTAVLNEKAVTATANPNEITLTYTSQPELGTTDIDDDTTNIFTYEMHVDKTFNGKTAEDADVDATAVKFVLSMEDGTVIPVKPIAGKDGNYDVWMNGGDGTQTYVTLSEDGKLVVEGLKDGTYYLEETATVDGYSKLPTKLQIIVKEDTVTKVNHIGADASNAVANAETGEITANELPAAIEGNDNSFKITVNNVEKQFDLPVTGGLGLWMFTIAGGVILAGAIIFFSVIRKKSKQS